MLKALYIANFERPVPGRCKLTELRPEQPRSCPAQRLNADSSSNDWKSQEKAALQIMDAWNPITEEHAPDSVHCAFKPVWKPAYERNHFETGIPLQRKSGAGCLLFMRSGAQCFWAYCNFSISDLLRFEQQHFETSKLPLLRANLAQGTTNFVLAFRMHLRDTCQNNKIAS